MTIVGGRKSGRSFVFSSLTMVRSLLNPADPQACRFVVVLDAPSVGLSALVIASIADQLAFEPPSHGRLLQDTAAIVIQEAFWLDKV